jgi:N-ethylmaleimide reductase
MTSTSNIIEQRATAGLIITEATAITHQGQGYADVPGLYSKEALDGWKRVTDAVHAGRRQDRRSDVACRPHLAHHPAAERRQAGFLGHQAKSKTYLVNEDGTGSFAETSEPRALEPPKSPASSRTTARPHVLRSMPASMASRSMPPTVT